MEDPDALDLVKLVRQHHKGRTCELEEAALEERYGYPSFFLTRSWPSFLDLDPGYPLREIMCT